MSDNTGGYIASGEPAHVYGPESVMARKQHEGKVDPEAFRQLIIALPDLRIIFERHAQEFIDLVRELDQDE